MSNINEIYRTGDWKNEKHVPVITCDNEVAEDQMFDVEVSIGKEIAHPNTTEHHIKWIQVFFKAQGDVNAYQVGNFEFAAHGEGAKPNEGPVYTNHSAVFKMKITKPGTLYATSFCNIHGIWESSKEIKIK